MLHSNVTGTPLTVNEVPGPREPQKTMRAPEIQACNPSELWTVTVGSVQALLQLRAQSLCSKTNSSDITFSWAWSGWRWQSDGGRGLGAADEPVLLCFIRRVLSRTNVFRIIWVLRMAGRGGGGGGGGGVCGVWNASTAATVTVLAIKKPWNPVTWTTIRLFHVQAPAGTHRWRRKERDG